MIRSSVLVGVLAATIAAGYEHPPIELGEPFDCERYCHAAMSVCTEDVTTFFYESWSVCMTECAKFPTDGAYDDFQLRDSLQCRTNHLEFASLFEHPAKRHCPHGHIVGSAYCNTGPAAQERAGVEAYGRYHFYQGTDFTIDENGPAGIQELLAGVDYVSTLRTRLYSIGQHGTTEDYSRPASNKTCAFQQFKKYRSYNGECNSLESPSMGKSNTVFSRTTRTGWTQEPEDRINFPEPHKVADILKRSSKNEGGKYMGCFKDHYKRALSHRALLWPHFMTIETCIAECTKEGYMYAGLQYGKECWCGDESYAKYGQKPESNCQRNCKGNQHTKCGGRWHNSVYQTALVPPKSETKVAWFNTLAAAWTQFMTHDWFAHAESEDTNTYVEGVEVPATKKRGGQGINAVTHWWDASQLYGSTYEEQMNVRTGVDGKVKLDENGEIMYEDGRPVTGFSDNFWVGLHVLHTLFAREHNFICDKLIENYPEMGDEDLFQTTRLIVSAMIAKIHTVEWTPTVLDNPTLSAGLNINWFGAQQTILTKFGPEIGRTLLPMLSVFDGIPGVGGVGGTTYMGNNAFQMPEEFVSSYRMHQLLPDEMDINGKKYGLTELTFVDPTTIVSTNTSKALFAALGGEPAGQLVLQNYPSSLYNIMVPGKGTLNLAHLDVYRDRERGVPRYNEARRQLMLPALEKFEDINEDPEVVEALKSVYDSVEDIDFMVGCMAEGGRPKGYGFGMVAYHVFSIIASRRLQSDRFYQENFNADSYTEFGMQHIAANGMASIMNRHFPELASLHAGQRNPFFNWKNDDA